MNHESFQQRISQLVDNELDETHEQNLFAHLGSCKECRRFLKSAWHMQSDIQKQMPRTEPALAQMGDSGRMQRRQDKPAVAMELGRRTARAPIRTFALALLVVVLGCVMLFSKVMVNEGGYSAPPTVQVSQARGIQ